MHGPGVGIRAPSPVGGTAGGSSTGNGGGVEGGAAVPGRHRPRSGMGTSRPWRWTTAVDCGQPCGQSSWVGEKEGVRPGAGPACAWIGTGGGAPVAHSGSRLGKGCPHVYVHGNDVAARRFAPFPTVHIPYDGYGVSVLVSPSLRGERARPGEMGLGTEAPMTVAVSLVRRSWVRERIGGALLRSGSRSRLPPQRTVGSEGGPSGTWGLAPVGTCRWLGTFRCSAPGRGRWVPVPGRGRRR